MRKANYIDKLSLHCIAGITCCEQYYQITHQTNRLTCGIYRIVSDVFVICIAGYFVYDFLDLMYHGKLRSNWEVTLHHIAVRHSLCYPIDVI